MWLNFAWGALGIGAIVAGSLVPGLQVLIPIGVGAVGHALPTPSTIIQAVKSKSSEKGE